MPVDLKKLSTAKERLQAAFSGAEGWSETLQTLSEATVSRGAVILPLASGHHDRPASPELAGLMEAYSRYWHQHDFRVASLAKMMKVGIAVDQDIVTSDGMARLPYYTDYLASHGLKWFAGVPFHDGPDKWVLTMQRTPDQGPFEDRDQDHLRRLGCALTQSVSVARRIASARTAGLMDGLDAAKTPALLLDRRGRVLSANDSVSEELKGDLSIRYGDVLLGRSSQGSELKRRIEAMSSQALQADHVDLLPLFVARPGRSPLVLRVRAIRSETAHFFEKASIMVLIDDPDRSERSPAGLLAQMFGLTPGQSRVAALIGAGESIKQCSEELGIGIDTVRTSLQKIFHKVGVVRQAELVRLISRIRM